jgi:dTDP-4-amino-4,6-dideoxygalactose transaminase
MCLGFNYRMTELQAAVGIAQLAKLDLIVQSQRQNKARLMDALDGLPVQYRATLDPDGDLADTLVFRWANAETAKSFVRHLTAAEVGTKNLPDALNWHFAGRWSHMALVQDNPGVHSSRWSQSDQILQTSVAIPVGVHLSEDQIDGVRRSAEAVLSTS